ncbi:MAG: SRPBCC domain-containing protein [Vulcanimicrobiaceae bacterium]
MQTSGTVTIAATRADVYAFVADPRRLATCIPGCSDLEEIEPGKYSALLSNKVAFLSLRFDVVVQIVRELRNEAIDATITGNPIGLAGRLEARAGVRLTDGTAGTTQLAYDVGLALTGKLGGLGQPVFKAKSEELSRAFGANVKAAVEASGAPA